MYPCHPSMTSRFVSPPMLLTSFLKSCKTKAEYFMGTITKPVPARGRGRDVHHIKLLLGCPWKLVTILSKLVYFTYLGDVSNLLI